MKSIGVFRTASRAGPPGRTTGRYSLGHTGITR